MARWNGSSETQFDARFQPVREFTISRHVDVVTTCGIATASRHGKVFVQRKNIQQSFSIGLV